MKKKKLFATIFMISILFVGLRGAEKTGNELSALDGTLAQWVEKYNIPSLSVGVIRNGEIVFSRAYGLSNLEEKTAATPDTIYRIGSCSKAFATAALGILVDRKKLKWNDRVRDHLPEFRLKDAYVSEHATIEDLLTHRMGFRSFDGDLLWYRTEYDVREIIERIGRLPLAHEFRTTKGYSNVMYMVAQQVIERVSGMTYSRFLRENVFDILGMKDSSLDFKSIAQKPAFARPYKEGKKLPGEPLEAIQAAGGVNASMKDMLRWTGMLLNNGKVGENRVLSESTLRELFVPRMINPIGGMERYMGLDFYLYGLGWNLYPYHNLKIAVHQGALPGYIANVLLVPKEKLGIVVLCNELTMLSFAVSRRILDIQLGVKGRNWIQEGLRFDQWIRAQEKAGVQALAKARKPDTRPSLPLKGYCGRYNDLYYGSATITQKKGKLFLSLDPTRGKLSGTLTHYHHDTFSLDFQDPYIPKGVVTFSVGPEGKISGFTFRIASNDFNFDNLGFVKSAKTEK